MAARKKSEEPSINIDEVLTDEELKAVANESEPAERKAKPEDGPRTVVVAEDEAVNRMDLVAMLEDNGYEVVGQAANGEEAVELTRKYRPDERGVHGCQDAAYGRHHRCRHYLR